MDGSVGIEVIAQVISTLGVGGILGWYLWYTTSVAEPRRDTHYTDSLERIGAKRDKHYTDSMERITTTFASAMTEERSYRRAEIAELKHFIEKATEASCRYNADHPRGVQ